MLSVGEVTGSALVFAAHCPPAGGAEDVDAFVAVGGAFTQSTIALALRLRPANAPSTDSPSPPRAGGMDSHVQDTSYFDQDVSEDAMLCSIFPSTSLAEDSPLRTPPPRSNSASNTSESRSAAMAARLTPGKKGAVVKNMPVTFHKSVKSSGYGAGPPPPPLFGGGPSTRAARAARTKHSGGSRTAGGAAASATAYPVGGPPPSQLATPPATGEAPVHASAALRLAFAPDGSRLATAGADGTARCLKLPLSKHRGAGTDLIGHDGPVLDVRWSHDGRWLITASSDRSAMLWPAGHSEAALRIRYQTRSPPAVAARAAGKTLAPSAAPAPLSGEVRAARLMHLDRLVFLAEGSRARVYSYNLPDARDRDDIARLRQMAAGFEQLPPFDDESEFAGAEDILSEVAERLHENYPYHHPLYAGDGRFEAFPPVIMFFLMSRLPPL